MDWQINTPTIHPDDDNTFGRMVAILTEWSAKFLIHIASIITWLQLLCTERDQDQVDEALPVKVWGVTIIRRAKSVQMIIR